GSTAFGAGPTRATTAALPAEHPATSARAPTTAPLPAVRRASIASRLVTVYGRQRTGGGGSGAPGLGRTAPSPQVRDFEPHRQRILDTRPHWRRTVGMRDQRRPHHELATAV